jgi:hypothetical protein
MFRKILNRSENCFWLGLIAIGLLIAFAGCGDDSVVGGGGGDDYNVVDQNLRIIRFMEDVGDTIENNRSLNVSGFIVDSNNVGINFVQVYLYADPSWMGYFQKAIDTTRVDGSFASGFLPIDTGEVAIWAQVAGNSANQTSRVVQVTAGSGGGGGDTQSNYIFEYQIPDGFILADGQDETEVTLVIHPGAAGVTVETGTVVKLEVGERFEDVNGDGYFTENVDNVVWDANNNGIWDRIGHVPATVTTVDSIATFTYTSGTQSGLVFLRTSIGNAPNPSWDELTLSLRPNSEVAYIELDAASSEIQVKSTGGVESTLLHAYCHDRFGNPVQQGIDVEFNILSGPNGGENIELQGYGPVTATTNVLGIASVSLLSGTTSGTIKTQANVVSVYSDVTLVGVNAGPPDHISVGVDPCNILGCGFVNETSNIVALVEDMYNNPVMDTTVVYFTTNTIGMVDASSVTNDGIATSIFRSTNECLNGRAWIIAETDAGNVKDSSLLWVSGFPASVEIYAYPSILQADGVDNGYVYVEVLDANGVFVLDGTNVEFDFWPQGAISSSETSNGCHASIAKSRLTSQVLLKDYSYTEPDDGVGAYGQLTATAGIGSGVSHTVTVQLLTGFTHTGESELDLAATVAPSSSEPMTVIIKDRAGNPLGGHLITAIASDGFVTDNDGNPSDVDTLYSNEYGEVVGFTYTAPATEGNAFITVTDHDPRGGIILTKKVKIKATDI